MLCRLPAGSVWQIPPTGNRESWSFPPECSEALQSSSSTGRPGSDSLWPASRHKTKEHRLTLSHLLRQDLLSLPIFSVCLSVSPFLTHTHTQAHTHTLSFSLSLIQQRKHKKDHVLWCTPSEWQANVSYMIQSTRYCNYMILLQSTRFWNYLILSHTKQPDSSSLTCTCTQKRKEHRWKLSGSPCTQETLWMAKWGNLISPD